MKKWTSYCGRKCGECDVHPAKEENNHEKRVETFLSMAPEAGDNLETMIEK